MGSERSRQRALPICLPVQLPPAPTSPPLGMMARVGSPGKTCKMKKLIEEMRRTVRTTETAFFSRYLRRFVEPPPRHLVTGCPTLLASCLGREVDSRLLGLLLVPSPNQQHGR